jgi:hypothetical protein
LPERSVTEAANVLGVSEMSASRAFDDVEGAGLPYIHKEGRLRVFTPIGNKEDYLGIIWPHLRDPVIAIYRLRENISTGNIRMGGISAVCHYSMLADNPWRTIGVTRTGAKILGLETKALADSLEEPSSVVQVMRYMINYEDKRAVDPLTAVLSLRDRETEGERVEAAVEEIKRKVVA